MNRLNDSLQNEIQRKIQSEENVKSLMQQINLSNDAKAIQKDYMDKVDRLQNEKYDLMNELDSFRRESIRDQEKAKFILDRLTQIRGFGGTFG